MSGAWIKFDCPHCDKTQEAQDVREISVEDHRDPCECSDCGGLYVYSYSKNWDLIVVPAKATA